MEDEQAQGTDSMTCLLHSGWRNKQHNPNFESKCRLLLDLVKLQLGFAGAFYDCMPDELDGSESAKPLP